MLNILILFALRIRKNKGSFNINNVFKYGVTISYITCDISYILREIY